MGGFPSLNLSRSRDCTQGIRWGALPRLFTAHAHHLGLGWLSAGFELQCFSTCFSYISGGLAWACPCNKADLKKENTPNHARQQEETHKFFKLLLAIVFGNTPWAKASPMDEPRVRMGACLRFFAFHVLQPGIWLPEMPTGLINPPLKVTLSKERP